MGMTITRTRFPSRSRRQIQFHRERLFQFVSHGYSPLSGILSVSIDRRYGLFMKQGRRTVSSVRPNKGPKISTWGGSSFFALWVKSRCSDLKTTRITKKHESLLQLTSRSSTLCLSSSQPLSQTFTPTGVHDLGHAVHPGRYRIDSVHRRWLALSLVTKVAKSRGGKGAIRSSDRGHQHRRRLPWGHRDRLGWAGRRGYVWFPRWLWGRWRGRWRRFRLRL